MPSPILALAAVLASGLVSWSIIGVVRSLAERHALLDMPTHRSAHRRPRPRLGGVGVVAAFLGGAACVAALQPADARGLLTLAGLSLVVAGVSLIDDIWSLPVWPRLIAHTGVALATVWAFGGVTTVAIAPGIDIALGGAGTAVTVVLIVALINAFNFMDGIDGIAGAQAISACAAWLAIGWLAGLPTVAWAAVLLLGATAGFLRHNWEPSTIFLGDGGATFLGYWLAVLPLSGRASQLFLPGLLAVWPFVADAAYTLVDRARRGESLTSAHQDHIYQRLVASGWSHARVALLYAGLSLAGGAAAVALSAAP
jgi:UDP-N-acetylmuramyl pentapeptide phosphotransferase/UDP-N-acetylglucosamine-1-phosphate transferase